MKERMNEAFLSLGGNMGDRAANLESAIFLLENKVGVISQKSKLYETEPWGSDSNWPYLNMVLKISTPFNAEELLKKILKIEKKIGRKRTEDQNADRIVDIDVLYFNNEVIQSPALTVPHPRIQLRKFILVPLNEIAGQFKDPLTGMTIKKMLQNCGDQLKVTPFFQKRTLKRICIEGNIGAGKTTLGALLAKKMGAQFIAERYEDQPLLPLFYEDTNTYALPIEYAFMIGRFQQLLEPVATDISVADYHFRKSLWFADNNLEKKDYKSFRKTFSSLEKKTPDCDLLIYIETSVNELQKNIKKRNRSFEVQLNKNYLEKVEKSYQKGLLEYKGQVLKLTVEKYDLETNKKLLHQIVKHLKDNFG